MPGKWPQRGSAAFPRPNRPVTIMIALARGRDTLKTFAGKRKHVADTKKVEDKLERKKLKRTARKKAAPKAARTTPRGEKKKKVKKLARGQSKR